MKIEVWSDIFCPFCYIGKRRLEEALEGFPRKSQVEVIYRSFELNPEAKKNYDGDLNALIAEKYGISYEAAKRNNEGIIKQAAECGLTFDFDNAKPTNSFDAHRMIHFAKESGKMIEMKEALFAAYFTDGKDVSDYNTLADIAVSVGLDKFEALKVLNSNDYAKEVRADQKEGSELGITGVPFFALNRKYSVSGAQPAGVLLDAIEKAWKDEKVLVITNEAKADDENEDGCAGGSCSI